MSRPPIDPHKTPQRDRRSGADRRKIDALPLGKVDRRRSIDSRKPEVVELDMSNSEWSALQPELPITPRPDRKPS